LDTENGEKVMELFRKINRDYKKTIVVANHEPTFARMADRIVHLLDGKLTTIEEVTDHKLNWTAIEAEYSKRLKAKKDEAAKELAKDHPTSLESPEVKEEPHAKSSKKDTKIDPPTQIPAI